ncbi:MAG: PKD domain-containing protein [Candidatus Cloacimonetes bacterium]|nr:PKD domain-containing protein [Candidatus Cloacimonadota bacterium]
MKKILGILVLTVICCINLIADLNDGLVGYWPFNGNANDESGNNLHGTVTNAVLDTDRKGFPDSAYRFDGNGDYILVNDNSLLSFPSNVFSISFWVNPDPASSSIGVLCKREFNQPYSAKWEYCLHGSGTTANLVCWNNHGTCGVYGGNSMLYTPDIWDHYAYAADGDSLRFYKNGVKMETKARNYSCSMSDQDGQLAFGVSGAWNQSLWLNGKLDEIRIYNRALSEEEVFESYHNSNADFTSPETSYVGEPIQFTDTSIGNPTSWEWDFENDGIYDSFVQYPTHIYTSEGIYSVKLKITTGTSVDSLIKENHVTVSYCPPASPHNVNVEIIQPDAIISWTAVDTTECGSQIIPDGYIVKFSENDGEYFFLTYTTEVIHTHNFVAQFSPQMFYRVIAFKNYSREQIEYLEQLNNTCEKIKWSEVKQNLNSFRK